MLALTSPVETPFHRLPAAAKVLASAATAILAFSLEDITLLAGLLGGVGLLHAVCGHAFFRAGLEALRFVVPFVVVVMAWHGAIGDAGEGTRIVLRLLVAMAAANFVTMTTPLLDMMALVDRVAQPLRWIGVSPAGLALAMALAIRFVPVFRQKVATSVAAWRARSPRRPRPAIVVPLLLSTFDDSERAADALRARGGIRRHQP